MSRLFLAQTTRHIVLQTGLAAELGGDNELCILEHFSPELAARFESAFNAWGASPFRVVDRVAVEGASYRHDCSKWERHRHKRRWLKQHRKGMRDRIDHFVAARKPTMVCMGYESYESQYACYAAKRVNPDCVGAYIEDGTGAYQRSFKRPRSSSGARLRGALRRLRHGRWWDEVELAGTSRWIDTCYLCFPELALPGLRRKQVRRLDPNVFRTPDFRDFAEHVSRAFELDAQRFRSANALIALSRGTLLDFLPNYEQTLRRLIAALRQRGEHVAVKYHPREVHPNYLELQDADDLYVLPPEIPFELLVLLLDDDGATVIGDVSTALMSTRWLRPGMQPIALQHCRDPSDPAFGYLETEFRQLGILLEPSPEALLDRLAPASAAGSEGA